MRRPAPQGRIASWSGPPRGVAGRPPIGRNRPMITVQPWRSLAVALPLLSLLALGGGFAPVAAAPPARPAPVLAVDSGPARLPDALAVTGTGFTPGGAVYVTLSDPWG